MNVHDLHDVLGGASVMACFVIGLKFLAYWRVSRDPFFIWFGGAFWVFALGWGIRALLPSVSERAHLLYLPRLLGFLMILIAILNKNRRSAE